MGSGGSKSKAAAKPSEAPASARAHDTCDTEVRARPSAPITGAIKKREEELEATRRERSEKTWLLNTKSNLTPRHMRMTPCMDEKDVHRLRNNLLAVKKTPSHRDRWAEDCRSSSAAALLDLEGEALADPGTEYKRSTHDALGFLSMHECMRKEEYERIFNGLVAQDKIEFSVAAEHQQLFNLDADVFEKGTQFNSADKTKALKKLLFAESEHQAKLVTLFSSPLNAVNLGDVARLKGAIPEHAAFFSFCYPSAVHTKGEREALRQRLVHGADHPADSTEAAHTSWASPDLHRGSSVPALDRQNSMKYDVHANQVAQQAKVLRHHHSLHAPADDPVLDLASIGLNFNDPFVRWMLEGAFLYFDFKYDIVGINAVSLETYDAGGDAHKMEVTSALYFGQSVNMQQDAIDVLHRRGRWWPVTTNLSQGLTPTAAADDAYTHFAWVLPSEFLGAHIFARGGGFAYRSKRQTSDQGVFFPVVNQTSHEPEKPCPFSPSCHIEELMISPAGQSVDEGGQNGKYWAESDTLKDFQLYPAHVAAVGLEVVLQYGFEKTDTEQQDLNDFDFLLDFTKFVQDEDHDAGLCVLKEIESAVSKDWGETSEGKSKDPDNIKGLDKENKISFLEHAKYVIKEEAEESQQESPSGVRYTRDKGNKGLKLRDFWSKKQARDAKLTMAECAALRVYTTPCYMIINKPLRRISSEHFEAQEKRMKNAEVRKRNEECRRVGDARQEIGEMDLKILAKHGHPLRFTTYLIYRAVKKLRACNMHAFDIRAYNRYLWRGLKDVTTKEDFMKTGGTDTSCFSTTKSLQVVSNFCRSATPLLLRIKIESPMEYGAEVGWLSTMPEEEEVLYPPLTYLRPVSEQSISDNRGKVVMVKPSFPS